MSLLLSNSEPKGVEAKSFGGLFGQSDITLRVPIRDEDLSKATYANGNVSKWVDVEMPFDDFFVMVEYALTNADLRLPKDPRLEFLFKLKRIAVVKGHNSGGKRLEYQ